MKFKDFKKVLALSLAFAAVVPNTALAAEPDVQMEMTQDVETEKTAEEVSESTEETVADDTALEVETPAVDEIPITEDIPAVEDVPATETVPEAEVAPEANQTPDIEIDGQGSTDTQNENTEVEQQETETPSEEIPPAENVPEEPEVVPEEPEVTPDAPVVEEPIMNPEVPTVEEQPAVEIPAEQPSVPVQRRAPVMKTEKKDNLRFQTVDKIYAFANTKLEFKEAKDEKAKTVGTLAINGVCSILKDEGDWYFAESGDTRGFIKKSDLLSEKESKAMLKIYQDAEAFEGDIEKVAPVAKATVGKEANKAYFHTKTTTKETVIAKKYALSTPTMLNVREGKGVEHKVVATLPQNALCYIIADADQDWVFVESGDVRGFVNKKYIQMGSEVDQIVKEKGEGSFAKANQQVAPKDNKAWYYTLTSVVENTEAVTEVAASGTREEIVAYASQYIGNPYVWGGTDPVNGADCSGFVQSIYRDFGIQIPRVAEDQAYAGTQIPVEEAQPGDLIFYMDASGYIYHVVMYAGNGTTVEAMNSQYGITTGNVMADACWAITLLDDTEIVEEKAVEGIKTVAVGEYEVAFAA